MRSLSLVKTNSLPPEQQVIDPQIAREIARMLRGVTSEGGTATRAAIADYPVAGKTGTAHKINRGGGYADDKYIAFFVGFAPAQDPRLVTIVVVDEPPAINAYSGGKAAAPIFASVMEQSLKVLNVPPVKDSNRSVSRQTMGAKNG
jgi:cell division protein FtsI (penicillin-binding protein 3)